jgi:hypothetical protein
VRCREHSGGGTTGIADTDSTLALVVCRENNAVDAPSELTIDTQMSDLAMKLATKAPLVSAVNLAYSPMASTRPLSSACTTENTEHHNYFARFGKHGRPT